MNFGQALEALKEGKKVARESWNGKGMFIYHVEGSDVSPADLRGAAQKHVGFTKKSIADKVKINGHIDMKAADGSIVVGWLASQTDMLAEDWTVVE
ncbi:DUF2829 domain-containing protein [Paenibacillus sp. N1-5-1-14]|uniref:DUF2829 domain-containing protein n=1 Tax=Paenibacillus radicibacter TaxID=2972488 RepID=UPI00215956A8|nr:DUF2829 domain-containing protein [Paenibacillus radicibacter]MCR8641384.1 DUF2829 domain-containing protein [Paenibacillus radicibacter]